MSKKLKELLERAEAWPEEIQDEAAETLLSIEQSFTNGRILSAEDREALARSAEDIRQGRFVDESVLAAFFERYRIA